MCLKNRGPRNKPFGFLLNPPKRGTSKTDAILFKRAGINLPGSFPPRFLKVRPEVLGPFGAALGFVVWGGFVVASSGLVLVLISTFFGLNPLPRGQTP